MENELFPQKSFQHSDPVEPRAITLPSVTSAQHCSLRYLFEIGFGDNHKMPGIGCPCSLQHRHLTFCFVNPSIFYIFMFGLVCIFLWCMSLCLLAHTHVWCVPGACMRVFGCIDSCMHTLRQEDSTYPALLLPSYVFKTVSH